MKITIICSSKTHPIYPYLQEWMKKKSSVHEVDLVVKSYDLQGGDILFLISCNEIIEKETRSKYKRCLVIHASDVPKGRG